MTPKEFQQLTTAYGINPRQSATIRELITLNSNSELGLIHASLKLSQSAGKISGMVNEKVIQNDHVGKLEIRKECNNVLVAVALIINALGMTLEDCMDDIKKTTPDREIVYSEKPKQISKGGMIDI